MLSMPHIAKSPIQVEKQECESEIHRINFLELKIVKTYVIVMYLNHCDKS